MELPPKVNICECWARDGIQGEDNFVPTEKKIAMINRMAEIGFKRIEVTSFAHPKLVKQFADSIEVLRGISRHKDVTYIAIVPNDKALDRLLDACDKGYGVQEITAIISASEDHLLANLEKTFAEAMPPLASLVRRARAAGLSVIGCIGTSFGCPLAGEVPIEKVYELTEWYLEQGATSIMPGDTTGEANPLQVREFYARMKDRFPKVDFISHFHDTRGMGLANTFAALQEGVVYHDCSFGSIGGQPATKRPKYHKGFSGNTCTEDMVVMMNEMGIETGLKDEDVIQTALLAEKMLGKEANGHVTRSGIVRHRGREVLNGNSLYAGMEIFPGLLLLTPETIKENPGKKLPELVIRKALEKSRPLPEKLTFDLDKVNVLGSLNERVILVTRFKVADVLDNGKEAVLEVLSQKSDGQVYLDGVLNIAFI